ncbi:hypothetical protein K431DRAFT_296823 [Polychaeton citri CBS 116435]|uniref:Orc1-like AAA ATPase domain-containing protein n=1 Tax=Polychaeton citri CBS 116435 TaxID=1314669 RepID=A0A9P4Q2X9_9PEZI|nr:hypothetical protein K431DRAFT_296823 [Polychaeton citri CBS 116435]
MMLPISDTWPCREPQLRQINALVSRHLPSPANVVVYGPHSTGKTGVVGAYLQAIAVDHAVIQCRETVTTRHLLERTVAKVSEALESNPSSNGTRVPVDNRCDNITTFGNHLHRLLDRREQKFVLVLDGIDKQREPLPTLLPALAQISQSIRHLTILFILNHPEPRFLHTAGVPHIHFSPYNRAQTLHVLAKDPPDIFTVPPSEDTDYDGESHSEDKRWLWPRFCAAVWDSLGQQAARDFTSFRDACLKIWRPFVQPIVKGDFGTRDFSRLVVAQRRLLQDDSVLLDSLVPKSSLATINTLPAAREKAHELPYYAKWILVAAYLASFNPARMDALYFMKGTERKRRKKGGGTRATPNRPSSQRKVPRHLLAASLFSLDRLLSILHAILPEDLRVGVDIYSQIATLSSLRLLVRSGGLGGGDPLEPSGKWRVGAAVSWEYIQALARSVDFGLLDYVAE